MWCIRCSWRKITVLKLHPCCRRAAMMVNILGITSGLTVTLILLLVQAEGRGIRPRCTKCINVASFANCIKPVLCYEVYGSPKHVMIARCERSHSIYFYPAISRHHAAIKSVDGETCSKFLISWLIGWFFLKLDGGLNKGIFDAVQFGAFFIHVRLGEG